MPGCKCQRISVSSALFGSVCQHPIDVSACKQSRRAAHENFFYPCLHLKDSFGCTMHVRVVKAKPLRLFCSTSLAQIHFSFYASVLWQWVQGGVGVVWVVAADATPGSQASAECFAWNTAVTAAAAANRGLFSFACGQHESACTSFFFFFTWWSL